MKRYGRDGFKPGDVVITNHQAVAGQHLNNVVIYMPYFFQGELLHVLDRARALDRHRRHEHRLRRRARMSRSLDGRAAARSAQNLRGGQGQRNSAQGHPRQHPLSRMPRSATCARRSPPAAWRPGASTSFSRNSAATRCLQAIQRIFDETETKCRKVVSGIPDGVYEAESFLDNDGMVRSERVRIHARVTVADGKMTIDLSGCSPERKAGINSRTLAGARVAYKALTSPLDPSNEGSFRRARRDHPRGQHHDGALSRAHVGLEPDRADGRRHHPHRARARDSRKDSRRRIMGCWAAPSYSSA